jgi:hypothetical protein
LDDLAKLDIEDKYQGGLARRRKGKADIDKTAKHVANLLNCSSLKRKFLKLVMIIIKLELRLNRLESILKELKETRITNVRPY